MYFKVLVFWFKLINKILALDLDEYLCIYYLVQKDLDVEI